MFDETTFTETSAQRRERYSRHLLLPQVGLSGQEKLANARVLIIGAGGLGAPALTYLAAAGVGTLGVIDDDMVDLSNLQRQVIHETAAIGEPKVESAERFITRLNPNTNVITFNERLTAANVFEIIESFDIVVDGTDNFPTRYLLNDACVVERKPYVWAAIFQFNAVVSIFHAGNGPCYRCIYPTPPPPGSVPSCAEGGVIGALPGLVGTTQTLETIKLILDVGTPLRGTLASFDGLAGRWEYIPAHANPNCPTCTPQRALTREQVEADHGDKANLQSVVSDVVHNEGPVESGTERESDAWQIEADALARFLAKTGAQLIDVRTPGELEIVAIPDARNLELNEILGGAEVGAPSEPVVMMCKSGHRSAQAAQNLRNRGYTSVYELRGGVLAWVEQVSPDQPVY